MKLSMIGLIVIPAFLFAQGQLTTVDGTGAITPSGDLSSSVDSAPTSKVQAKEQFNDDDSAGGSSSSSASTATADPAQSGFDTNSPAPVDDSSKVEHSLFASLFMAGKTQDQFTPLTPKKRLKVYSEDLFSPFHFFMAGASAGVAQAKNIPSEWGQGAEGYGRRYANYYATATVSNMLQMAGDDLLHEDNLYYGSGEHGVWRRVKYAVKSSVLARGADGTQHFSISQVGSTAGAAFISRLWQPRDERSFADGAQSFGIALATNAGVNIVREFLPDVTRRIFHRTSVAR